MTLFVSCVLLFQFVSVDNLPAQCWGGGDYYIQSDLFPPIGRYISPPETSQVSFSSGPGTIVKNIVLRNQTIIGHPPTLGNTLPYVTSGILDYKISYDNGTTWQNGTSPATCAYSLYHQSDAAGIELFVAELTNCDVSGGDLHAGVRLRVSPTLLSSGHLELEGGGGGGGGGAYRINSFFDIYWELTTDYGSSWIPASGPMRLALYVPGEAESSDNVILPLSGVYRSKAGASIQWASGILARKFAWYHFTGAIAPPSLGGSTTNSFGSQLDFEYSTNGGVSWSSVHASPNNGLQITSTIDDGTARFFNVELTQMDATGGTMPPGMEIRESPTRVSMGGHSCHTVTGGYEEESFFDVFLEISVDGGESWSPLTSPPLRLEIDVPPSHILATAGSNGTISPSGSVAVPYDSLYTFAFSPDLDYYIDSLVVDGVPRIPSSNYTFSNVTQDHTIRVAFAQAETSLASPNYFVPSDYFPQMGRYMSPPETGRVLFSTGIAIMNMVLRNQTMVDHPPALGHSKSYSTSGQMDYAYSTDGGMNWMYGTSPATSSFNLYQSDSGSIKTFELELASCTITGGDLPVSVSIRESPTRLSAGQMELGGGGGGGGCRVNSFFDAYWEISTDGALTWTPASDSIRLTLHVPGQEQNTLDLFPPVGGQFDSKPLNWAMWPNGMFVKNCHWHGWSASVTPPAPGFSLSHTCSSTLDFEYSLDAGLTWSLASAPASLSVLMTSTVNDGSARFFDLELTALSVSGGGMPSNMLIRESPTKTSRGAYSTLSVTGGYECQSFFDVYLEVSDDGGSTWFASVVEPLHLELQTPPSHITATAGSHGNISPSGTIAVPYDSLYTFTFTANSGYRLDSLKVDGIPQPLSGSYTFYNVTADHSIYAAFSSSGTATITVTTSPVGRSYSVDGVAYTSAQTFNWTVGSMHTLATTSPQSGTAGTQYVWTAWDDGGALSHSVTVTVDVTITAKFKTQYLLTLSAGVGGTVGPASGYYDAGSPVKVTAIPDSAYCFSWWWGTGDSSYSGSDNPVYITMYNPMGEKATFGKCVRQVTYSAGWHLMSFPYTVTCRHKDSLFSMAASKVFTFSGHYVGGDTVQYGVGQWLKFSAQETAMVHGPERTYEEIPVAQGWNMIGSIAQTIPLSAIGCNPSGIVSGNLYGYKKGYFISDSIYPGEGYWIKVSKSGTLILQPVSASLARAKNHIRIVPTPEMPPAPPEKMEQAMFGTPSEFKLGRAYPNPFNPSTVFSFSLPKPGYTVLKVYNTLGKEVDVVYQGNLEAGDYSMQWSAAKLSSGVYFYRLQSGEFMSTGKLVLIR